jgi:hypothetical protein
MSSTPRLAEALQAVTDSRAAGWPERLGPYDFLVTQELQAPRLTHIGFIPGVLLDVASVEERQRIEQTPQDVAKTRTSLLKARQAISEERMAAGELEQGLLLRLDVLSQISELEPERAKAQLQKLVNATTAGWDIRLIRTKAVEAALPRTYSMTLMGEPTAPEGVYIQKAEDQDPHELFIDTPATPEWSGKIYSVLSGMAFDSEFSGDHLQQMLKHYE